ncbi:MAG: hypothetical protein LUH53_01945 [Lachnospiraceae bacterium]|nr:hypothetical protein [Lachnospiraceae bacterium]
MYFAKKYDYFNTHFSETYNYFKILNVKICHFFKIFLPVRNCRRRGEKQSMILLHDFMHQHTRVRGNVKAFAEHFAFTEKQKINIPIAKAHRFPAKPWPGFQTCSAKKQASALLSRFPGVLASVSPPDIGYILTAVMCP